MYNHATDSSVNCLFIVPGFSGFVITPLRTKDCQAAKANLPNLCLQDTAGTDFVIHPTEFDVAFTSFEEDTSANGTEF